jgi:7-cyano-7-deazaguanine synthase
LADAQSVEPTVQVTAQSLYEAVRQALRVFREEDWSEDRNRGPAIVAVAKIGQNPCRIRPFGVQATEIGESKRKSWAKALPSDPTYALSRKQGSGSCGSNQQVPRSTVDSSKSLALRNSSASICKSSREVAEGSMKAAPKVLVLHSGGLDSTVCLLQARSEGRDVISLGIDYGQRHRVELEYAAHQCRERHVPRRVIRIEWDKPTLDVPTNRSLDQIRSGVSPAFLPGRNLLFLSLACAEASGVKAEEVWIGVNALDFSGYPDCRPDFLRSFENALALAIPGGPEIRAPLLHLTKPEIAAWAHRLGLARGDTWSCYRPKYSTFGIEPCQTCDACVLHDYAWNSIGSREQKTKP